MLILLMIYLRVPQLIAAALDKKIAGIEAMLDEATTVAGRGRGAEGRIPEEVLRAPHAHAAELKTAAEEEAKQILAKAKDDATALIARRERMAEDKIAAAERAAVDDLRAMAADAADSGRARPHRQGPRRRGRQGAGRQGDFGHLILKSSSRARPGPLTD